MPYTYIATVALQKLKKGRKLAIEYIYIDDRLNIMLTAMHVVQYQKPKVQPLKFLFTAVHHKDVNKTPKTNICRR